MLIRAIGLKFADRFRIEREPDTERRKFRQFARPLRRIPQNRYFLADSTRNLIDFVTFLPYLDGNCAECDAFRRHRPRDRKSQ